MSFVISRPTYLVIKNNYSYFNIYFSNQKDITHMLGFEIIQYARSALNCVGESLMF